MIVIPLVAVPAQRLNVTLAGQACAITVYQKTTGVYLDLTLAGVPIIGAVRCHDRCRLVRQSYLGFAGDLSFVDTQGTTDPTFAGFGARFLLAYFSPTELA